MIKIRDSFLKQLIFFSMMIVLITILIGYILDIFFMNSFYTERKKRTLLAVRENIIALERKPGKLDKYISEIQMNKGVQITLLNQDRELGDREGREILKNLNILENENFSIIKISKIGNTQLIYRENLESGKVLIMRTSLSLIDNYRAETDIFNFIATLISIFLSGIICYFFSKAFIKDIKILNKTTEKIAQLEFPSEIENLRKDEIGDLSRNIKKMSENLKISIENLESFVGDASHELKTPITVITTCIQSLIKNSDQDEKQRKKNYEIITQEINELNSLLENLLALSKIKSLGYKLQEESLNLKKIVSKSLEKYENLELEKDIVVINNLDKERISGDERLLKLVIDNIVQNSLKYSPYGEKIFIYIEDEYLKIENKIEKIIIEKDEIWKPFVRDNSIKAKEIEGSGLGLSIVKRALEISKKEFGIETNKEKFIFFIKI